MELPGLCPIFTRMSAYPPVPAEVRSAAEKGLDLFKSKVGPKATTYGFTSSADVSRVTLGQGFQVHYVDGDKLRNSSPNSLLGLVAPQKVWEFTVNLDGMPKSFLTIAYEDGEYRVVHFGGDAQDFGMALQNYGDLLAAKGANSQPIVIKAGPAYYLAGTIGSQEFVLPAVSSAKAEMVGGMSYSEMRPANEVVQYLQKIQRESVPGRRGGGADSGIQNATVTASSRNVILIVTLGLCLAGVAGAAAYFRQRWYHR
jgi:hypothetical protein